MKIERGKLDLGLSREGIRGMKKLGDRRMVNENEGCVKKPRVMIKSCNPVKNIIRKNNRIHHMKERKNAED